LAGVRNRPIGRCGRSRWKSDGEALAAFGAPRADHGAAAARLHAHEKTVRAGAADLRGLVSAFHVGDPWSCRGGRHPAREPGGPKSASLRPCFGKPRIKAKMCFWVNDLTRHGQRGPRPEASGDELWITAAA